VFQLNKLIDTYKLTLSTELEVDSNFYVTENTYVHVDADKLNNILSTNRNIEDGEDEGINQLQFNEEDDENKDENDEDSD
jgi:hypothetical protein